ARSCSAACCARRAPAATSGSRCAGEMLISPRSRRLSYTAGPSCENPWVELDYAEWLGAA
ncbi:MAG: hypothetical protein J0H64_06125, partial [Actinobacteria bacterium]|nr:hypothetical protein [Actinomycetota bacterium]